MPLGLDEKLAGTSQFLLSKTKYRPKIALVLGSGFGSFNLDKSVSIKFKDIPHFIPTSVEGHPGELVFGLLDEVEFLVLRGRLHLYEGYSVDKVVYPIRTLATLGINRLILSNAAGGINPLLKKSDFMVIVDHINLTGTNPLVGKKDGVKFLDMTYAYDPSLTKKLEDSLSDLNLGYQKGVYCGVLGPSYETPSEVKLLKIIGADAVGMSTVNECIAANEMGLKVAGISCITNAAPGTTKEILSHEDVCKVSQSISSNFDKLIRTFVKKINH